MSVCRSTGSWGLPGPDGAGSRARDPGCPGLSSRGNYEILVEWLTIAAASGYEPALPRVREVLTDVGRMKYLKPLYTALMSRDETAAFAREVFAEVQESYHPLSRGSVEGILAG